MKRTTVTVVVTSIATSVLGSLLLGIGSANAGTMKPGLWEFTNQTKGAGMPAMPTLSAAERKQMEAMGIKMPNATSDGGMAMTSRICITPEQAKRGVPPDESRDEKCEQKDVKVSGNTTTWSMVCTGKHKMTGKGSATYANDENFSGESDMTIEDGAKGPQRMQSRYNAKFISADCKKK